MEGIYFYPKKKPRKNKLKWWFLFLLLTLIVIYGVDYFMTKNSNSTVKPALIIINKPEEIAPIYTKISTKIEKHNKQNFDNIEQLDAYFAPPLNQSNEAHTQH